jgi:Flp pilus assembly protein TadG
MVRAGILSLMRRGLGFARDARGVSAVEFALILPVMLSLYLGGDELGHGLTIARKVTHVSSSLSDLVTQSTKITDHDMTNILNAAASVITPYSTSNLTIVISEYYIDKDGKTVTVQWSDGYHKTGLDAGTPITNLPSDLLTAGTYLITADVDYAYTPTVGYIMTGTFDIHDQFYLRPRLNDSGITRTSS